MWARIDKGLELASEAAVFRTGDESDCSHGLSPSLPLGRCPAMARPSRRPERCRTFGAKRSGAPEPASFLQRSGREEPACRRGKKKRARVSDGGTAAVGRQAISRESSHSENEAQTSQVTSSSGALRAAEHRSHGRSTSADGELAAAELDFRPKIQDVENRHTPLSTSW